MSASNDCTRTSTGLTDPTSAPNIARTDTGNPSTRAATSPPADTTDDTTTGVTTSCTLYGAAPGTTYDDTPGSIRPGCPTEPSTGTGTGTGAAVTPTNGTPDNTTDKTTTTATNRARTPRPITRPPTSSTTRTPSLPRTTPTVKHPTHNNHKR
ncbi:unannotated protein [freshwater metagenome]|uniref:Unannotated protein n=1 Tax=freshwater metagenome TaxID=449393 RepID=A0A6J6A9Z2_9ZZZZ